MKAPNLSLARFARAAEVAKLALGLAQPFQALPEGLRFFVLRRPCPVEYEAYSSGVSAKQKKNLHLRTSRL